MTIRKPTPKKAVEMLVSAFTEMGKTGEKLKTKVAYDLLAQLEGYKNWAHASPVLTKAIGPTSKPVTDALVLSEKYGFTAAEILGWPVFVMFVSDNGVDDDIMVMPPGSTLDNRRSPRGSWTPFDESGSIILGELFDGKTFAEVDAKRLSSLVVTESYSVVPRPDRYGVPDFANERGIKDWLLDDLGWNYLALEAKGKDGDCLPAVEVNFYDSGDDTSARYWLEVAVAPDIAKKLEQQFAAIASVTWKADCLDSPYKGNDPLTLKMRSLSGTFADCDGKTLGEIWSALERADSSTRDELCEQYLREELQSELITVNGPYDLMTTGAFINHFIGFLFPNLKLV